MKIEAKRLDGILARFAAMSSEAALAQAVTQLGNHAKAVAKQHCHVNNGELRNSIFAEQISFKEIHVVVGAEYGLFVEYGTGLLGDPQVSHTDKEMWSYQTPDGKWYTTHGQAPQPFMQPAALAVQQNAEDILTAVLRKGKG